MWVVYGLGNVLSNRPSADQWPGAPQDAMIVTISAAVHPDGSRTVSTPSVFPSWADKQSGWVIRNVLADLADTATQSERRVALEASLARMASVVGDYFAQP